MKNRAWAEALCVVMMIMAVVGIGFRAAISPPAQLVCEIDVARLRGPRVDIHGDGILAIPEAVSCTWYGQEVPVIGSLWYRTKRPVHQEKEANHEAKKTQNLTDTRVTSVGDIDRELFEQTLDYDAQFLRGEGRSEGDPFHEDNRKQAGNGKGIKREASWNA